MQRGEHRRARAEPRQVVLALERGQAGVREPGGEVAAELIRDRAVVAPVDDERGCGDRVRADRAGRPCRSAPASTRRHSALADSRWSFVKRSRSCALAPGSQTSDSMREPGAPVRADGRDERLTQWLGPIVSPEAKAPTRAIWRTCSRVRCRVRERRAAAERRAEQVELVEFERVHHRFSSALTVAHLPRGPTARPEAVVAHRRCGSRPARRRTTGTPAAPSRARDGHAEMPGTSSGGPVPASA